MFELRLVLSLCCVGLILGCAKANVTTMPSGDHRIVCERGMKLCISRADKLCGDDGYVIVSGTTKKHLLGGASSSYREMAERAELVVSCGNEEPQPQAEEVKYVPLPPRTDEPVRAQACVPGATQICVGAGACQGGQVCAPDGSAFGACDCGPAPVSGAESRAVVPAPAPTQPAPAQPAPRAVPGAMPPAEPL
jgi:hypothetical protein